MSSSLSSTALNPVATVFLIPFRLVRLPLHILTRLLRPLVSTVGRNNLRLLKSGGHASSRPFFPVSGLDEAKAQGIYFALQRASSSPRERAILVSWMQALQVAQVASGRLIHQTSIVDANARFWRQRLARGGHFWFALLRRGPAAFVERIVFLLNKNLVGREGGGTMATRNTIDAEVVEARVLLFGVLRSELCEALAEVQQAASLLYLNAADDSGESGDIDDVFGAHNDDVLDEATSFAFDRTPGNASGRPRGSLDSVTQDVGAGGEDAHSETSLLFMKTESAVKKSMVRMIEALEAFQAKTEEVLRTQALALDSGATDDREAFSSVLQKALGITTLKKMWSGAHGHQPALSALSPQTSMLSREVSLMPDDESGEYLLRRARAVVGWRRSFGVAGGGEEQGKVTTVHDALQESHIVTAHLIKTSPLISIPRWMLMPTPLQQHWIRYTCVGIAAVYGGHFVIKHSALNGSEDLENWAKASLQAIQAAWKTHVIEPLENLQGELFNTFRARPSIVSLDEYEADRDSLKRMLQSFKVDVQSKSKIPRELRNAGPTSSTTGSMGSMGMKASSASLSATEREAELNNLDGLEVMMHCYEKELRSPIKNFVAGDLMRSLLIQVQQMKVNTESAMLEIDQILKANELSISLVAAVPAFLIGGACLYAVGRVLTPAPPDPRREASRSRLAMVDVERSLEFLVVDKRDVGRGGGSRAMEPTMEQVGEFWFRLAVAYNETELLFQRHSSRILRGRENEEWIRLRSDLLALANGNTSAELKLRSAARILRVYSIYQR